MDARAVKTIRGVRADLEDLVRSTAQMMPEERSCLRALSLTLHFMLENDLAPPECRNCASALEQPATGRPREYCNPACRKQRARLEGRLV